MTSTKNSTRTKSKSRKPVISFCISETMLNKVNAEAQDLGMDRSSFIALCVSQYFRNLEALDALKHTQGLYEEVQKLRQAMVDVEAQS